MDAATATATPEIKTIETSFTATSVLDNKVVGGSDNILMITDGAYFNMSSRVPSAPKGYVVSSVRAETTLITTFKPSVPGLDKEFKTFIEALLKVLKLSGTTIKTITNTQAHVLDVNSNEILAIRLNDCNLFDVQFYRLGSKKCDSQCKKTDRFGIVRFNLGTKFGIYGGSDAAIVNARLTEEGTIMCGKMRIHSFGQFMHDPSGFEIKEIDLADKLGALECLDKVPHREEKWCLSYFCNEHWGGLSRRPFDVEETTRVAKKARVGNKQRVGINFIKSGSSRF